MREDLSREGGRGVCAAGRGVVAVLIATSREETGIERARYRVVKCGAMHSVCIVSTILGSALVCCHPASTLRMWGSSCG